MEYSEREKIAHVARRLGMGSNSRLAQTAASVEAAIAAALDISERTPAQPVVAPPDDPDDAGNIRDVLPAAMWWLDRMASGQNLIEERLGWFWHDHFAIHAAKTRYANVTWSLQETIRRHATGNFAELLHAVATGPAMLLYLDAVRSTADEPNENFAREVMELHTVGPGAYTEADVVEVARAFTGWVVKSPFGRLASSPLFVDVADWDATLVRRRWDAGTKTILGSSADHDLTSVLDLLLDHPTTARFIAAKLHRALVGWEPEAAALDRIADRFRSDYDIMALVQAIVEEPAFTSSDAIRSHIRTPLEQVVSVLHGAGLGATDAALTHLRTVQYLPFTAPNPAGFPKGDTLLGPHRLVHTFDLMALVTGWTAPDSVTESFAMLGVFDVSEGSAAVVAAAPDHSARFALTLASPEFALT